FFQAEDGIRDFHVTGVQTCALPILCRSAASKRSALNSAQPSSASAGPWCGSRTSKASYLPIAASSSPPLVNSRPSFRALSIALRDRKSVVEGEGVDTDEQLLSYAQG